MEYKHLTQERREYIDDLVGRLKQKYTTGSEIDFEFMARDHGIIHLKSDKNIIPVAYMWRHPKWPYVEPAKKFVVTNDSERFSDALNWGIAHEYGHHILKDLSSGHAIAEDEANYFADNLTDSGFPVLQSSLFLLLYFIKHPIHALKSYSRKYRTRTLKNIIQEFDPEIKFTL